jgi:hypothetical protein
MLAYRRRPRRGLPCYEVELPLVLLCPRRHLRMAESKSRGSGNDFNAHSEKIPKCEPISINKLVDISEFRVSDSVLPERRVSAPSHLMSQLGSIVAVGARLNTSRETSL